MKRKRTWAALVPFAAFLPPLLAMLLLTVRYGITVQTVEQLQFVPLLHKTFVQHRFGLDVLFWQQPTSDHFTFFPMLGLLAWAPLSGWNVMAELAMTPIFTIVNGWLLLQLLQQLGGKEQDWQRALQALATGLVLCSPHFWWGWTWSMSMLFTFMATCCLSSLTLLAHPAKNMLRFWIAAAICIVATYSFGNGFLCWATALPLLLADARHKKERRKAVAWIVLASLATGLYVTQYRSPGHIPHPNLLTRDGLVLLSHFFSIQWGQALVYNERFALFLGRMILAMGALLLLDAPRRGQQGRVLLALAGVMLFSAMTSLLVGWSRGTLGTEYAFESRYGPMMAIGVAVPVLLLLRRLGTLGSITLVLLLLLNWLSVFPLSHRQTVERHQLVMGGRACLETYRIASDACLGLLYFGDGKYVRRQAELLDELGFIHAFALPKDIVWHEPQANERAGTLLTPVRRNGSMTVAGTAKQVTCAADTRILVTAGKGRTLIGTTFAITRWSGGKRPCGDGVWSIELSPTLATTLADSDIAAWSYDAVTRTATRLERT